MRVALLALSLFLFAPPTFAGFGQDCFFPLRNALAQLKSSITQKHEVSAFENVKQFEDSFTKDRGLRNYVSNLGPEFRAALDRFASKEAAHYLDAGGGNGLAIRDLFEILKPKNAKATLLAYESKASSSATTTVMTGRFIENIPNGELPKSDLITDVFGPLAYSGEPHVVLSKYVNSLNEDGELFLFLGSSYELFGKTNRIITANKEVLSLSDWIERIPGLEVTSTKRRFKDEFTEFEVWSLKIKKKKGETVIIPDLILLDFKPGAPPTMLLQETAVSIATRADRQRVANAIGSDVKVQLSNLGATQFLDAFRSGEFTHPLIKRIKRLRSTDSWLNVTRAPSRIIQEIQEKQYDFSDASIFVKLAQRFMRWSASRIDPKRFQYSAFESADSVKAFSNVSLITDYYGDFMTSLRPTEVLSQYVQSLKKRGEIFLYLGSGKTGFGATSEVVLKSGKRVSLQKWLESLPGLKVIFYRGGYRFLSDWTFVRISVKDPGKVRIPELQLLGVGDSTPDGARSAVFQEKP